MSDRCHDWFDPWTLRSSSRCSPRRASPPLTSSPSEDSRGTSVTAGFMVVVGSAWIRVDHRPDRPSRFRVVQVARALCHLGALRAGRVQSRGARRRPRARALSLRPDQQGLRPLIVLPAAAVLLGEAFGPLRGLGVALIVAGGWFLSRQPGGGTADVPIDPSLEEADGPAEPGAGRTRVQQRTATRSRGFVPASSTRSSPRWGTRPRTCS